MATIHLKEIMDILASKGQQDASIYNSKGGYFLEILCNDEQETQTALSSGAADDELANSVISANSAFGTVLILFDAAGMLKSLEFS